MKGQERERDTQCAASEFRNSAFTLEEQNSIGHAMNITSLKDFFLVHYSVHKYIEAAAVI